MVSKKFNTMLAQYESISMWIPLFDLFLRVFIVAHFVAISWHFLAIYEDEVLGYDDTWMMNNNYN